MEDFTGENVATVENAKDQLLKILEDTETERPFREGTSWHSSEQQRPSYQSPDHQILRKKTLKFIPQCWHISRERDDGNFDAVMLLALRDQGSEAADCQIPLRWKQAQITMRNDG